MKTLEELTESIITDLGANFKSDDKDFLTFLVSEVFNDALICSNRDYKCVDDDSKATQIDLLSSNIRKACKTIYLSRGAEDVKSNSLSGISNTYDNAVETMKSDIIKQGKRIVR